MAPNSGSVAATAAAAAAVAGSNGNSCGSIVVESRMKLPVAAGRWSALWMMPMPQPCMKPAVECGAYGPWPASGEIDIVEQVNTDQEVLGTIHFADRLGVHQYTGDKRALTAAQLLDWNIYQLVWNCSSISWLVNSEPVFQVTKQDLNGAVWPFDEPFFLILNTAVGGWLTGGVAPEKGQSQPFLVDYVRVWGSGS
jgi:beta-glucanase (GH16 family)